MNDSVPNGDLTTDSQYDFHKNILLRDDGAMIVDSGYGASSDTPMPISLPDVNYDAFNRLRVSATAQRFDCEFIYDKQEEIMDEVIVGSGAIAHQHNTRDLLMTPGSSVNGDKACKISYDIPYTPGNSQLIAMTGVLNANNISGGTVEVFLRSKVTGVVTEVVVEQTDWDHSNNDVDWTKAQILEMDFQSLKVGVNRFFLNRKGKLTHLHTIHNDNIHSAGYWQLPTLPITWSVRNVGSETWVEQMYGDEENGIGLRMRLPINASATCRAICGTVKSEGGRHLTDLPGYKRSADLGETKEVIGNTLIPILSIKPKALFKGFNNRNLIIPEDITITTDNPIRFVVLHNTILTGAVWNDVDSNSSCVEYDRSATSLSNGHVVFSDYISGVKNIATFSQALLDKTLLWNRRGTETGILTLAAIRTTTTNADVLAAIRWKEIR